MGPLKLLLDTCAFLWLAEASDRLSSTAAQALDDDEASLFLSDASVWEICLKWQAGKILLPSPPRRWIDGQFGIWDLKALPVVRSQLYRMTELPSHHRDPFDRLLVAQAIEEAMTIVTPDPQIARYPVAVVW